MKDTPDWQERWTAALREQHEMLFDPKTKSLKPEYAEHIHCPVCSSSNSVLWFEKDWFHHVRCQDCSMVYMNPRMNLAATHSFYNSDANAIYNETKFDQVSASTQMDDDLNLENLRMLDDFRGGRKGTLLEIGSAKGFFLLKAMEVGYEIHGLELNRPNNEYSRKKLGDTILDKDLSQAGYEENKFDVVYMRDVIEHIAEPLSFLREVQRVTKPGGLVFIDTHNVDGWIYKLARERHTVFFGFEHPNHLSPRSLGKALAQAGFAVAQVRYLSLDFTLKDILTYMLMPGFTTIYPKPTPGFLRIPLGFLRKLFNIRPLGWLDRNLLPPLANLFHHGSVMKVIAEKTA